MELETASSGGSADQKENAKSDKALHSYGDVKRKRDSEGTDLASVEDSDSSPAAAKLQAEVAHATEILDEPGPKRTKFSDDSVSPSITSNSQRVHGLPPQLWGKILSLLPPVFLGRLLRVSKDFKSLLTVRSSHGGKVLETGAVDPQDIWLSSHRRYAAGLPAALPGQSELDMWRLIRGNSCQLCGVSKPLHTMGAAPDPWSPIEGDGVRVVWPFGIRCCAPCLQSHIEQESSLHFSSSLPSFLIPILPCVFLNKSKYYVHSWTVKNSTPPRHVQLSKVYYKPELDKISSQFEQEKAADTDVAKSWLSELQKENDLRTESILIWEQWEAKGGLRKVNSRAGTRNAPAPKQLSQLGLHTRATTDRIEKDASGAKHMANIPKITESNGILYSAVTSHNAPPVHNLHSTPAGLPPRPLYQTPSHRPERDLRDVTEAKAARRAEIEKRCLALEPPIPDNILRHMDSFQAALQIPQPLTEQGWELLKPRLLDQRAAAEKEEHERIGSESASRSDAHETLNASSRTIGASIESNAQDAFQKSVQDRLSIYANERIRQMWSNGAIVTQSSCPTFAADVLLHVKQRFDDVENAAAKEDKGTKAAENVLILEHMKWLFDNKIRTFTDPYNNKEIFLCSVCEGDSKYYGFEAVIQHYAAKHTNELSQGNVVVHWRAKWPEQPPFHPNPGGAAATLTASTPATGAASNIPPGVQQSQLVLGGSYGPQPMHLDPYAHGYPAAPHPPPFASPQYHQQGGVPVPYPGPYANAPAGQPSVPPYYPASHPSPYGISPGINSPFSPYWPAQTSPIGPPQQQGAIPVTPVYQSQMDELAKIAREVWFGTSGVKEMPASLRIYVVIQHVANRFVQKYSTEPSLAMFLDGLNQSPLMRPVRSLNELMCKICSSQDGRMSRDGGERKSFTLPLLLNHFKNVHLENPAEAMHLNWRNDMVQLPEAAALAPLINASGMDEAKLALISHVLPGVFRFPYAELGRHADSTAMHSSQGVASAHSNVVQREHDSAVVPRNANRTSEAGANIQRRSRSRSQEGEVAGEDEYDPHRPAYLDINRAAAEKQYSSKTHLDQSEGRTGRARASWSSRRVQANENDYDPKEPMIHYPRGRNKASSPPRTIKREDIEADQFLNRMEPEIKTESAVTQPNVVARTPPRENPHEHQYGMREADFSRYRGAHEHMGSARQFVDRGEHASYEHPRSPHHYHRSTNDHHAYERSQHFHPSRGLHVQTEHLPSRMQSGGRVDSSVLEHDDHASRPIYYYPDNSVETRHSEVAYVAGSPNNHAPVYYRPTPSRYIHPPEDVPSGRHSQHYEYHGHRIERYPVEMQPQNPRPVLQRGQVNTHASQDERAWQYGEEGNSGRHPPFDGEGRVVYREYR